MRLVRRESIEEPQEGTEEYKHAIKSVIRCQIQSLLKKLASETGEESIVISTNVTAGTYSQFGSYMGQEYLVEKDHIVQSLSIGFSDFCAEKQNFSVVQNSPYDESVNTGEILKETVRTTLHASRKKTPRKRPLTPNYESPPNKRKQYSPGTSSSHFNRSPNQSSPVTSPAKGSISSQVEGDNSSLLLFRNSSQNERETSKVCISNLPFIKTEPADDYILTSENCSVMVNGDSPDGSLCHDTDTSPSEETVKNSIINRPTSLIPLANIFKKYGTKPIKNEPVITPESVPEAEENETNLPSEKSILRSLYEQPLYGMDDYSSGANDSESTSQVAVTLPRTLNDNTEQFPSTTENLVLSGYYDSDNYPAYRHHKKHLTNGNSRKSKNKDKSSSGTTSAANPSYIDSLVSPGGTDLKMRMFESNGRLVYACDVCKRELSHLTSYRRHMKLHTMDRPHKCPVCTKGFIRKYHCIDHINKHHKGVEFDPDTLTLRGSAKSLDDSTAYSESLSISPNEYNYTLDQSIDENDQSLNTSIDQSASNMLSELARSAQKAQLLNQSATEIVNVPTSEMKMKSQLWDDVTTDESEKRDIKIEPEVSSEENENPDEFQRSEGNGTEMTEKQPVRSSPMKAENSSLARKYEVTEGIKAIVAHLKSSSKKKKMMAVSETACETVNIANEEV